MMKSTLSLLACAAVLGACFEARADEPGEPPTAADSDAGGGVRFRGGIASELVLMTLVQPTEGYVGSGFLGHAGVQLGDVVGVYASPYVGFQAGIGGGPYFGSAILTDFTIADRVSLGLGPEFGYFHLIAGRGHHQGSHASVRVHGAVYPFAEPDGEGRRSGLVVGTDLRVMLASVGFDLCGGCEQGGPLMLSSGLFVGYETY